MKRAIIYSRVSTDEQAEYGTGLDGQEAASLAYAESIGVTVVATFREDYTGTTLNRPELTKARAMLRAGQTNVFIAHRADRLDRSEWGINLLLLLQELKGLKVELHYSQQRRHIDLTNPQEGLMQAIAGWQAGEDRNAIVKRLTEGRRQRSKAGHVVPVGILPYGYDKVLDNRSRTWSFVIVESEAAVIRLVYDLYLTGNGTGSMSAYEVCRKLEQMGIAPPGKRDERPVARRNDRGRWYETQVQRILTNETYAGIWHYGKQNGNVFPVDVPPIVDREIWQRAVDRVESRRAVRGKKPIHNYLMSRRLKCTCGYAVSSKTKTTGYYTCPGLHQRRKGYIPCSMPSFRQDHVDPAIWDWIREIFENETILQNAIDDYRTRQKDRLKPLLVELDLIEQSLADVETEHSEYMRTLRRLSDSMVFAIANTQAAIERCEEQINELTAKRQAAVEAIEAGRQGERNIIAAVNHVAAIKAELGDLDWNDVEFETKRFVVDRLNVEAVLEIEDGQRYLNATCHLYPGGRKIKLTTDNRQRGRNLPP